MRYFNEKGNLAGWNKSEESVQLTIENRKLFKWFDENRENISLFGSYYIEEKEGKKYSMGYIFEVNGERILSEITRDNDLEYILRRCYTNVSNHKSRRNINEIKIVYGLELKRD